MVRLQVDPHVSSPVWRWLVMRVGEIVTEAYDDRPAWVGFDGLTDETVAVIAYHDDGGAVRHVLELSAVSRIRKVPPTDLVVAESTVLEVDAATVRDLLETWDIDGDRAALARAGQVVKEADAERASAVTDRNFPMAYLRKEFSVPAVTFYGDPEIHIDRQDVNRVFNQADLILAGGGEEYTLDEGLQQVRRASAYHRAAVLRWRTAGGFRDALITDLAFGWGGDEVGVIELAKIAGLQKARVSQLLRPDYLARLAEERAARNARYASEGLEPQRKVKST